MTGEPNSLFREVAAVLRRGEVLQDGIAATFAPAPDEPRELWVPLLDWCLTHRPKGLRGLVGIAAAPGAGKSHFLAGLAATARALRLTGFAFASMDGYHLPNAVLDARVGIDAEGRPTPLRLLKGCPSTFGGRTEHFGPLGKIKPAFLQLPRPESTVHQGVSNDQRNDIQGTCAHCLCPPATGSGAGELHGQRGD